MKSLFSFLFACLFSFSGYCFSTTDQKTPAVTYEQFVTAALDIRPKANIELSEKLGLEVCHATNFVYGWNTDHYFLGSQFNSNKVLSLSEARKLLLDAVNIYSNQITAYGQNKNVNIWDLFNLGLHTGKTAHTIRLEIFFPQPKSKKLKAKKMVSHIRLIDGIVYYICYSSRNHLKNSILKESYEDALKHFPPTKPATAHHFINSPMPKEMHYIPVQIHYSKNDFAAIKNGLVPREMEDKWFVYVHNGHIYIHRSWSGYMIYDCIFEEGENQVTITGIYANRDKKQYDFDKFGETSEQVISNDISTVKNLLHCLRAMPQ